MTVTNASRRDVRAPSWDTVRPARRGQWMLVSIGVLVLPPALLAAGLRVVPPSSDQGALLASFIPYGIVGWIVASLCFLIATVRGRTRRPALAILSLIAVSGLAYQAAAMAPFFVPDRAATADGHVRLLSLNMQHGYADPAQLSAAAADVDLVVLVEATPVAINRLDERGWRNRFPYVSGATADGGNGSVVYSRFPLQDSRALPASSFQQWMTTVQVPQLGDLRLFAVHPCNPLCGDGDWAREHAELRRLALAEGDAPLVLAGDFNAIDDHGPLLQLRRDGFRSATDLAGAGWLPTWPANKRIPPMIPIDHVLVNDALTAVSIRAVTIGGTDHLGLLTELAPAV